MKHKGLFYVQDNRMLMSKISAISVVDKWAPYSKKYPKYLEWQNLMDNFVKDPTVPLSMKSGFQTANEMWAWMMTERAFMGYAI